MKNKLYQILLLVVLAAAWGGAYPFVTQLRSAPLPTPSIGIAPQRIVRLWLPMVVKP
ncbi:MAG: hypothetical protein H0U76_29270 [Ktedonobacteraceae bacterium]|nr:hypothetical protein [Ktedonobacteraceae bacterium]